ncbi:wtf meiotic driver [Schizosaccharomyces osmophilus]|uniref:Wtf meiotic driver n=1 Tax=Schizosaccharomyces osmophilus TaxID=2545709 RepID=A0AAE9WEQ6_9SCHI|nr:wtf meiotic driver [Schizosaccharomyces osmophilus]WBW74977.1 wtf meiotic driver [Schizosaccharomyces osmophilus]
MKNKYTPISDSDDSSNTLNDEKADTHSSDGTPPPYSASNKFIDLEIADGSAQNSAQDTVNNTRSSSMDKWQIIMYLLFFTSFVYIIFYAILLVLFFTSKVFVNAQTLWGLSAGCAASFALFLFAITQMPKEWFPQAKQGLTQAGRATKQFWCNMCIATLFLLPLDVSLFIVYYKTKRLIGFETVDFYCYVFIIFLDIALLPLCTTNADAREQLGLIVVDLKNGIGSGINGLGSGINGLGNGINGLGNGIGNAVDHMFGTNRRDEAPPNEEIELQPLAEQSAEV